MNQKPIIILTTIEKEELANSVARQLIEKKLAACVSVKKEITSYYKWNNDICKSLEFELQIKTSTKHKEHVFKFINLQTSYECPQQIIYEVELQGAYYKWFLEQIE